MSEPIWVPLGSTPPSDPGVEVAYGEFTAGISVAATASPGTLIVAAPSFTADGTSSYFVDFFVPKVTGYSMQNPSVRFELFDGTTSLGFFADWVPNSSAGAENVQFEGPLRAARRLTPAAGARSYNVKAWHGGSNPPAVYGGLGGAGVLLPGYLRVTKVPSGVQIPTWTPQPVVVVTSLPASPVDGQEVILVDSLTNPTYSWHLKFIAASTSAYKWVFIGGADAFMAAPNESATTRSTAYDLATPCRILVPRAGDYIAEGSAAVYDSAAGVQEGMTVCLAGNPGNPAYNYVQTANYNASVAQVVLLPGLAAGADVRQRYYSFGAAGTANWSARNLAVRPLRLA